SLIEPPEWRAGPPDAPQGAVAFVIGLTKNQERLSRIKVVFERAGDHSDSLTITCKASPLDRKSQRLLGTVGEQEVHFLAGEKTAKAVSILQAQDLQSVVSARCGWEWILSVSGEEPQLQKTVHRVYVLLDEPTAPWGRSPLNRPWMDVLDVVCSLRWAGGAIHRKRAQNRITHQFNRMGATGELVYGGTLSYFLVARGPIMAFVCTDFLCELRDGIATPVDCRDAATAITVFCNILGCKLLVHQISRLGGESFELTPGLESIGRTPLPPSFQFHEIALLGAEFRARSGDPLVWDGSLRIDIVPGRVSIHRAPASIGLRRYLARLTPCTDLKIEERTRGIAVLEDGRDGFTVVTSQADSDSPFFLGQIFDGFELSAFTRELYFSNFGGGATARWKSRDSKWGWLFGSTAVHKSFDLASAHLNQLREQVAGVSMTLAGTFQDGFEADGGRTVAFRRGNVTCRFTSFRSPAQSRVRPIAMALDNGLRGNGGDSIAIDRLEDLNVLVREGLRAKGSIRLMAKAGRFIVADGLFSYDGNLEDLRAYRHKKTPI
ncbi:MAG TPA: hypothetical protein VFQ91_20430, partial [Bryobacteraceae bacterium]|nr:hypothetical protein [Bryobacteraceae bacterium]